MKAKRTSRLVVLRNPPSQVGRRAGSRGFTLIELMVTLAIVAILATMAVPSFSEAMLSSKLNTLANNFVASAQLARSEAIKRNATVMLCASRDRTNCGGSWSDGWVVRTGGKVIHSEARFPKGYYLIGAPYNINFQPTGVGATAAALTLCRATPTVGSQKRTVTVSATGRPGVKRVTETSTCP